MHSAADRETDDIMMPRADHAACSTIVKKPQKHKS